MFFYQVRAETTIAELKASAVMLPGLNVGLAKSTGQDLLRGIKRDAPKKSGVFAKGLKTHTVVAGTVAETRINATGAHKHLLPWILEGTKPHTIRSKGDGPMAFEVNGITRFAYEVHHPGTRPNNFVDNTVRETIGKLAVTAPAILRFLPMAKGAGAGATVV